MTQSMVWFQKTIVSILLLEFPNSMRSANSIMFPEKKQADQIFEATGVKGGLVVHLGCGNGKLAAAREARKPQDKHPKEKKLDNHENTTQNADGW
jgi:hypothetical protein